MTFMYDFSPLMKKALPRESFQLFLTYFVMILSQ